METTMNNDASQTKAEPECIWPSCEYCIREICSGAKDKFVDFISSWRGVPQGKE